MAGQPSHIEIGAPDVERARRFYGKLLGWTFQDTGHGASIEMQGMAAGIHPDEIPGIQVFFTVEDIDQATREVVALGGEVDEGSEDAPSGRYVFSCRDDQGIQFGLHQPPDA